MSQLVNSGEAEEITSRYILKINNQDMMSLIKLATFIEHLLLSNRLLCIALPYYLIFTTVLFIICTMPFPIIQMEKRSLKNLST